VTPHARLQRCRGCRGGAWDTVLEMEPMPLAGQFCRSEAEARAADLLPLTWVQCRRCALVQVLEDVADEHLFQRYNYASSSVPGLVRHFDEYAAFLARRLAGRSGVRLLEIGCNDGVLLRRLPGEWTRVGVDPSDVARQAPAGGYRLIGAPFGSAMAEQVPDSGAYDVVTGSNCLAHIADLADVLEGARRVLREGGELWIEVHDLDATLAGSQWDTIYHEHKVEWSERSLDACVGAAGFTRVHLERLPLHGGLLRAGYRKFGSPPCLGPPTRGGEDFAPLRAAYDGRRATPVYRALSEAVGRGERVAAYGASGRANVWLNQVPELRFEYVVDDAPLRMGRWLPRVATPVVPSPHFRESPPDACVITAWNYARDIRAKHGEYRGTWLQTFEG